MERYFIIDKFNTYYDWGLILTEKDIAPPEPKTYYVDIDGMDGSLDLSEALTNEVTYDNRSISAKFWTDNGSREDRNKLLNDIRHAIHGKKIKIIEPDDPEHYFIGRLKISNEINNLAYAEFIIEGVCEPYRYSVDDCVRSIEVKQRHINVVLMNNGRKTVIPEIETDGIVNLIYEDKTFIFRPGVIFTAYELSDIKLQPGANVVDLYGGGSITFRYKEADI